MADALKFYHALPPPLRHFAASVRGWQLARWRYGPETEALVAEAHERERWSPTRWRRWQEERLAALLHRAATRVPFYRAQWEARRRRGDRASWEALENWPVLRKADLRRDPRAFLADDCDPRRMYCDRTGGSTGTPLAIYLSRETVRRWYALYEARIRRWHGVSIREPWAILGGQLVVPFRQERPPFWVYNAPLRQLYLSTHHLCREHAPAYAAALRRYAPSHMVVYPSSAAVLAAAALEAGLSLPRLAVLFSNSEALLNRHRALLSEAFGCPVRNTYGMGEIAAAASECEHGALHLWPEVGIPEVFADDEDRPLSDPGATGRLILTGLLNADMPLIRYEVGDRGRLGDAPGEAPCPCGRSLPRLAAVEGRTSELVVTPCGRKIYWLNPVFYDLPIREAQIVQDRVDRLRVRFVPAPEYGDRHGALLVERLRARVGEAMAVELEPVAQVPRGANGKFRAVVNLVAGAEAAPAPDALPSAADAF